MKKLFAAVICVFILVPALSITALAAPGAEITMRMSDAVPADGDIVVTVDITISAPSEPYASLEFNLVSGDHERLAVVDLGDNPASPKLDITFTSGYGGASHRGRPDGNTGGYRYLIGIFSQSGGNLITGATDICTVRLRYSGDEPQTLRVRDLKLVYVDDAGGVASAPIDTEYAALSINRSVLETIASIDSAAAPLSGQPDGGGIPVYIWIIIVVLAAVALVLAAVMIMLLVKNRKARENSRAA